MSSDKPSREDIISFILPKVEGRFTRGELESHLEIVFQMSDEDIEHFKGGVPEVRSYEQVKMNPTTEEAYRVALREFDIDMEKLATFMRVENTTWVARLMEDVPVGEHWVAGIALIYAGCKLHGVDVFIDPPESDDSSRDAIIDFLVPKMEGRLSKTELEKMLEEVFGLSAEFVHQIVHGKADPSGLYEGEMDPTTVKAYRAALEEFGLDMEKLATFMGVQDVESVAIALEDVPDGEHWSVPLARYYALFKFHGVDVFLDR